MDTTRSRRDEGTTRTSGARRWVRLGAFVILLVIGVLVAQRFGLFERITVENLSRLELWFEGLGPWAPIVFILVWVAACLFFLPGLPVTLAGGLVFGALWGTVYTSIGATLGATAAFLLGRHAARETVEGLVRGNRVLRKIDEGVTRQGWRMLLITRLVPLFPFNAQNYVYGLTKIPLATYVVVSLVGMLPGTLAFNLAAGSVRSGGPGRFFLYLSAAAVCFVLLSLIPGWIRRRLGEEALLADR